MDYFCIKLDTSMSNTLPKPRRRVPATTNIFTFEFETQKQEDGSIKRLEMKQSFSGQKLLLDGDDITPTGYKILIACLADNIKQLAALASRDGMNPLELIGDAGKRLGLEFPLPLQQEPEQEAKIIELPKFSIQ